MIRWRQSRDDNGITELVRTQLVPISPWQHPKDSHLNSEISRRMRRGATLVVARTRRSPPLGFLHMEFRNHTLFIDLLAVDSKYQNRHWGTELMLRAEEYGRKKGCAMSRVFVDEDNTRALNFYHRLGYHTLRALEALRVIELVKVI